MNPLLLRLADHSKSPLQHLQEIGEVFASFGPGTQDSGNYSFSVRIGQESYFIKTTGAPSHSAYLPHHRRQELLLNAYQLHREVSHPLLVPLHQQLDTSWGIALVYEWVAGELIYQEAQERQMPDSPYNRLRQLPHAYSLSFLTQVIDLHVALEEKEWVAGDFYDGNVLYDFSSHSCHIIDLDSYHKGSYQNKMGRMFGSSRFMAPEEHELGAFITPETTVYNIGKLCEQFLSIDREDGFGKAIWELIDRACKADKTARFSHVRAFQKAWTQVIEEHEKGA